MTKFNVNLNFARSTGNITGTVETPDESEPADVLSALCQWLANIDPEELERVALEAMELGSGSYSAEVLNVLRRWAGGDP